MSLATVKRIKLHQLMPQAIAECWTVKRLASAAGCTDRVASAAMSAEAQRVATLSRAQVNGRVEGWTEALNDAADVDKLRIVELTEKLKTGATLSRDERREHYQARQAVQQREAMAFRMVKVSAPAAKDVSPPPDLPRLPE